ncbi:MAG TPA: glycogen debranching N-terminal domain-containing protein [Ktedonobacteraceae bacterium]
MPVEIRVGPPTLTISQGRTFMVTTASGEILSHTDQGVYALDTRFINLYRLYINREPLTLINSSQVNFYSSRIHLTNPALVTMDGTIDAQTIRVTLNRIVNEGIHEDIDIANYSGKPLQLLLEIALRSDFADLFEVKAQRIILRGQERTEWDQRNRQLRTSYDNQDFHRAISYQVLTDRAVGYANGRILFEIALAANEHWHTCCEYALEYGQTPKPAGKRVRQHKHQQPNAGDGTAPLPNQEPHSDFEERQTRWQASCTSLTSSNEHLVQMYRQAIEDMGALRIYDMDVSEDAWIAAAGVPWFVTLFGRDSLTVSFQNMAVSAGFARGALKRLAEHQATERDDWREAQPGKIMHEIRFGELAHFRQAPFTPFYGTADATILYLIVLSEAYRWTGNLSLLEDYRQVAENCLQWIDQYGDLDADGFQEYQSFSSYHYENVGWKDASDSVVYADGTQVKQPKGLCELQGYVYDAKVRMAEVFAALGDEQRAQQLREQAATLKQRFNELFWMEAEGCYAYGLDPSKQQITSITSNPGHCLWSGIAEPAKAARTAQRLLQEDMWNGWGIRTLSSNNPAYNPFAYQRGSIWPQDNGIIAAGFKRYGLDEQANVVIRGIFDAIERFDAYRPPEVFAGVQREGERDFPILYPGGANIPQAWATGSIFHMLRTILGLRADAPHNILYVRPTLPDWLPDLELGQLRVGAYSLTLRFWREGALSRWEVKGIKAEEPSASPDAFKVLDDPEIG